MKSAEQLTDSITAYISAHGDNWIAVHTYLVALLREAQREGYRAGLERAANYLKENIPIWVTNDLA